MFIISSGIKENEYAQWRDLYEQIHGDTTDSTPPRWTWLLWVEGVLVGYTAVTSLPGLPGIYELNGGVIPHKRRQKLGSTLFQYAINDLSQQITSPIQLSYGITSLDTPAAHFLQHHGFFVEHEELLLIMNSEQLIMNDEPHLPLQFTIHHSPFIIHYFLTLYEQSFATHPWYQPFSAEEMEATLADPHDLLFLQDGDTPIGFAWVRLDEDGVGEIEPIGILPAYQGQGNGRCLLIHAIHTLQKRGARQIKIGVWANNHPALQLYQSVGFQPAQTLTYLARNL